jgi:hypothetical protein
MGKKIHHYSEADEVLITRLWKAGASIKFIALELQKPDRAIMNKVRAMKLPKRRTTAPDKSHKMEVKTYLDPTAFRKVGIRAMAGHMSLAEYVRQLVLRDLGLI